VGRIGYGWVLFGIQNGTSGPYFAAIHFSTGTEALQSICARSLCQAGGLLV
jgi:hypothetical protein